MFGWSIRELNSIPRHRLPAFVPIKYDYFYDWQSFESKEKQFFLAPSQMNPELLTES